MSIGLSVSEFDRLSQFGEDGIDAFFGKAYVVRWNGQTCQIALTVGSRTTRPLGSPDNEMENPVDTARERCFIAKAAELKFDGVVVEPQSGMEIAEPLAVGNRVYRVVPRRDKRCFEPADAEGVRILINTNYIRTEAA